MAQAPANRLPSLPSELIEVILSRTPVESLLRFKRTCKQWYELISSDTRFMQSHLDHLPPERFLRIDDDRAVQIMDPASGILSEKAIPYEFRDPLPISWMVHCDGLMLCICEDWERGRGSGIRLAVWNPFLRKIKWIEHSDSYEVNDYFGFGYANSSRDNYKILRIGYNPSSSPGNTYRDYEIYAFKSDNPWKRIGATIVADTDLEWECVSVKGNMYWMATDDEREFILCFDFSTETFKDICDCPLFWDASYRLESFNGDRLSFLTQDGEESRVIEVYLTNKLSDEVVSFANYFNVTTGPLPRLEFSTRPGYSLGRHRNIMAWCELYVEEEEDQWLSVFTFFEIDEGGLRRNIVTRIRGREDYGGLSICSYVYVPSLIPVPQ